MANFLDNVSIKNKFVFGLLLTLLISIGIGVLEFNKIVKIQNNFQARKVFNDYQSNFIKLQNLYYRLEVSTVKLANAKSKDELVKQQNRYKSINVEINSVFEDLDNIEFTDVKNQEYFDILTTYNDSIFKYETFYNEKVILSIKKLDEYVTLTFHPQQVADNYERLVAEQQQLGKQLTVDLNNISKDEIIWDLMNTYEIAIKDLEKFISSKLSSQEFSLGKLSVNIQEILDKDSEKLTQLKKSNIRTSVIVLIISILFVLSLSYVISNSIIKPLFKTNDLINKLSKGDIPDKVETKRNDEIGVILESVNKLVAYLKNTTQFSKELAEGKFSHKFNSSGDTDVLGNSLIDLKDSLVKAKREEKRREVEDSRRRRTADGIAIFSDILRQNQNDLKKLGREVVSNLVRFIKANQGVLFTMVDEENQEPYLKLLAAYAWNREKFLEKDIEIGEGLIGSVAEEKFTVYMTDVPEDYIEIKSGTGSANPKSILIVPLKVDQEVLGVIEIASFHEFEQYEIELVETIAENIASTLKSVRITAQTSELLEKFQIQAAEMKEQEEAMKSTINELRESQEKMKKNEEDLLGKIKETSDLNKQIEFKDEQLKNEVEKLKKENEIKLKQIKAQQKQSREILESMMTGVIIVKQGGDIDFVNKAVEEIFGYDDMELLGVDIEKIIESPPDIGDKKLCEYLYENILKIKESQGKEFYIKLKEGKLKKVLIEAMVLHSESADKDDMKMVIFVKDMERFERKDSKSDDFINKLVINDFNNSMKLDFYEELLKENKIEIPEFKVNKEEIIKWGPKFELGISMIDKQHKKWIKFINELYKGIVQNKPSEELSQIFKRLMDYTDYHFGFEEKYMSEFNFENIENHKISHQKFINKLNEMFIDYIEGRADTAYNLILYLKKWVSDHVIITDRKYVELFKKHGIR